MNPMKLSFRSLAGAAASAALVVCAAGALTAPVAVGAQATGGELTQAVGALRGISTLRADFVQTDRNGGQTRG
ncbi:MAG TPA: outer membrane lipoprotein carrier protein LolA, partial [Novosphingobium sp.]|nr:outer membrane lipoprotein carrier protein LolA [Novosphingobium sp.]